MKSISFLPFHLGYYLSFGSLVSLKKSVLTKLAKFVFDKIQTKKMTENKIIQPAEVRGTLDAPASKSMEDCMPRVALGVERGRRP